MLEVAGGSEDVGRGEGPSCHPAADGGSRPSSTRYKALLALTRALVQDAPDFEFVTDPLKMNFAVMDAHRAVYFTKMGHRMLLRIKATKH